MLEIVQHQSGDGDCFQDSQARRCSDVSQLRVLRMKCQWHKCPEPAGLVLLAAEAKQVVDTVLGLLDVSGTVRGEVGRIWLFLLWPAAIAAAPLLSRSRGRVAVVTALVLLQVCQAMLMRAHLTMYSLL